ncbi:MAG: hypothetical protein ACYS5V_07845 [Planctomycetota bacterium]
MKKYVRSMGTWCVSARTIHEIISRVSGRSTHGANASWRLRRGWSIRGPRSCGYASKNASGRKFSS